MIKWDGLDNAIVGKSTDDQLVYNADKIIDIFMERDGMDQEEAREFFWFNVEGSRNGKDFPVHVFLGSFCDMKNSGEYDS